MTNITVISTQCAICGRTDGAIEIYCQNFNPAAFSPALFSARRLPDNIHYRIVKCSTCGLIRSDPTFDLATVVKLYKHSTFDYGSEISNLKLTYGYYLAKLNRYGAGKGSLLEIGCGNGFFLEQALMQGYAEVKGVDPSIDAVSKASKHIQQHIICDVMREGMFQKEKFDVICMFQVFDHIPNPAILLDECFRVLKKGGLILSLNHNINAVLSNILRQYSPIIDIEHTYLYSPSTMARIFKEHRFLVKEIRPALNRYSLCYLFSLLPFLSSSKRMVLKFLKEHCIGRISLKIPLGNLFLIAQK